MGEKLSRREFLKITAAGVVLAGAGKLLDIIPAAEKENIGGYLVPPEYSEQIKDRLKGILRIPIEQGGNMRSLRVAKFWHESGIKEVSIHTGLSPDFELDNQTKYFEHGPKTTAHVEYQSPSGYKETYESIAYTYNDGLEYLILSDKVS